MALTGEDKKWVSGAIRDGVVEALEQVVFPELIKIEKRMEGVEERLGGVEGNMEGMEERLGWRIDKLGGIITETRTNHERRSRNL